MLEEFIDILLWLIKWFIITKFIYNQNLFLYSKNQANYINPACLYTLNQTIENVLSLYFFSSFPGLKIEFCCIRVTLHLSSHPHASRSTPKIIVIILGEAILYWLLLRSVSPIVIVTILWRPITLLLLLYYLYIVSATTASVWVLTIAVTITTKVIVIIYHLFLIVVLWSPHVIVIKAIVILMSLVLLLEMLLWPSSCETTLNIWLLGLWLLL